MNVVKQSPLVAAASADDLNHSPLSRVREALADLDREAQRVALQVCFYYWTPSNPDLIKERSDWKHRVTCCGRVLRNLHSRLTKLRLENEITLGDDLVSLSETIRALHIPEGEPVLLPIPGNESLQAYFRQAGLPDPAQPLDEFLNLWLKVEALALREMEYVRDHNPRERSLARKNPRHFWRNGRLEYTLRLLFKQNCYRSLREWEIEERIAQIMHILDGGGRAAANARRGRPAVREAIKRVAKNPIHRSQCDSYLKSRLSPSRH